MANGRVRSGWAALTGFALLAFAATFAGAIWAVLTTAGEVGAGRLVVFAAQGAAGLAFWAWIAGGAWRRATRHLAVEPIPPIPPIPPIQQIQLRHLQPDRADERSPAPASSIGRVRVGPWGWVGRVLLGALVAGFAALLVVGTLSTHHDRRRAERVQQATERLVAHRHLTVAQVRDAKSLLATEPDALDRLLSVPGASIVDADASSTRAALLIRPNGGSPCVVLYVERLGTTHTEITDRCT